MDKKSQSKLDKLKDGLNKGMNYVEAKATEAKNQMMKKRDSTPAQDKPP